MMPEVKRTRIFLPGLFEKARQKIVLDAENHSCN